MFQVRPTLIAITCGIALIGHAPAWMHVATCQDCTPDPVEDLQTLDASVSDCCHCCENLAEEPAPGSDDQPSRPSHNPESCSICQSLACPVGVAWDSDARVDFDRIGDMAMEWPNHVKPQQQLTASYARGPPTAL